MACTHGRSHSDSIPFTLCVHVLSIANRLPADAVCVFRARTDCTIYFLSAQLRPRRSLWNLNLPKVKLDAQNSKSTRGNNTTAKAKAGCDGSAAGEASAVLAQRDVDVDFRESSEGGRLDVS